MSSYASWLAQENLRPGPADGPLISVIMPVYDTQEPFLREAIGSLRAQSYKNWQLCVVDDASPSPRISQILLEMTALDSRIEMRRLERNSGIVAATNAGFAMARGAFAGLFDHDDTLAPDALASVAAEIQDHPECIVVFSDEDHLVDGRRRHPYFKPGWNPDLMLSQNLVSHFGVYRKAAADRVGGMREGFDGSQDYDFALRVTAGADAAKIRHIAKPLYHWRQHPHSFSAQRMADCQSAARAALTDTLGDRATVDADPEIPQWSRIVWRLPDPLPFVSLIVQRNATPAGDPGYDSVEIVEDDAGKARGDILVFLAPNLVPARDGWLAELAGQALRPEIGAAGARLDRPDGRVCNAGYTLDGESIVQTLEPNSDRGDRGYFGHFLLARSVAALSGDCFAIRTALFKDMGGFDARAGAYRSTDLCLRLAERGLRCIWTPQARLRYRTPPPPPRDPAAARFMRERWGKTLAADPYQNPNLVIRHKNLALAPPKTATRKRLFWS
jgi:GT2 family glycosyltransferase